MNLPRMLFRAAASPVFVHVFVPCGGGRDLGHLDISNSLLDDRAQSSAGVLHLSASCKLLEYPLHVTSCNVISVEELWALKSLVPAWCEWYRCAAFLGMFGSSSVPR